MLEFDFLTANPPYTRAADLPSEDREKLKHSFATTTTVSISGKPPVYVYFLARSIDRVSKGGAAGFLTPQEYLATQYGTALKQYLLTECAIKAFIRFDPTGESLFDDANVTSLITVVEKRASDDSDNATQFIRVDDSAELQPEWLQNVIDKGDDGDAALPTGVTLTRVPQADLDPTENWLAYFTRETPAIKTEQLPRLGEFVSIHRGQTSGAAGFFCLTQDEKDTFDIDTQHVTRVIRKPALVDGYMFTDEDWEALRDAGEPVWLLDPDRVPVVPDTIQATVDQVSTQSTSADADTWNLAAYLVRGVKEHDLHEVNTLQDREPWYRIRDQASPRVLVPDATRDGFTFVLNETPARHIKNFRGFYDVDFDDVELKALLAYLNSGVGHRVLNQYTYTQQGGYDRIRISTLEDVPVLDPTDLSPELRTDLATTFDELCATARSGGDCGPVRDRIDTHLYAELPTQSS
ncbi:hypothetical protein GCM10008995_02600 [Halobellus salinus]|uniref:site-specific DNA-methyltransferase (adenine-specific) n=1 Tax=Halobellus salinus TaxID=931585 RepID=A0A830E781_9EURY|nr:N-6 DNA methylase [Halobellus salinus]GGI96051.1 hypothetical protein GCM10008995_02600 [Halobellus salinus]SMP12801.1 Eco57I restriction-modification methylase [Halobellus salinus]